MESKQNSNITLNVQWMLNPQSVPAPANNLLIVEGVSVGNGESTTFDLHFGHVSPPALFAETPQQMMELAADTPAFVNEVAHLTVTIDALRQMHEVLSEAVKKHDTSRG